MWFEYFLDFVGWLKITLSTTLLAALGAVYLYTLSPNDWGLWAAIAITTLGFITGVIWASRIWKMYSTYNVNRILKIRSEKAKANKLNNIGSESNHRN